MDGLPHNVIVLIVLLAIMAAIVVSTFVFVLLADRSLEKQDRQRERRDAENEGAS